VRRALLIDIDDTVVDWIGPAHDAVVAAVATHPSFSGRQPAEVAARFMEIVEETHALWLAGELSADALRAERIRRLVRETGSDIDADEASQLADDYRRAYLAARRPVPGAAELLREVRRLGARVVAVTNNLVAEQEDKLRHIGIRDLFDDLVVSEAAGVSKPDPAIFELAVRAAGAPASDVVMLGDSWENDVRGATGAGIAAAWLDRHGRGVPDEALDVLVLSSLEPASDVAAALLSSDA
jgi:putative hydrolase of the HAD superfamily